LPLVTIRELLDAGVHFGHKVSKWNPKMRPYIIQKKNNIHIINLKETVRAIVKAAHFLRTMAAQGKTILFVGTRRSASMAVKEQAERCGMPYINYRWLGGFLTNREVILQRIDKYYELLELEKTPEFQTYSKKQIARHNREKEKILKNLSGVMDMKGLPDVLLVVGLWHEDIAVAEARKVGIPVVAIGDTDADPDVVDCCIPANDESFRSVSVILRVLTDSIIEGKTHREAAGDTAAVSFGPDKEAVMEEAGEEGGE